MSPVQDSSELPSANPAQPVAPSRTFPFHPLLFVMFPVFILYAANYLEVVFSEVAWLSLGVFLVAASLYSLRVFYPSVDRAALAASYLLMLTFFYGRVKLWSYESRPDMVFEFIRFRYFLGVGILLSVACLLGLKFLPTRGNYWMRILYGGVLLFVTCTNRWYFTAAAFVALCALVIWGVRSWTKGFDHVASLIIALVFGVLFFDRFPLETWCGFVIAGLVAIRISHFDDQKATRLMNSLSLILICSSLIHLGILAARYSPPTLASESADMQSDKLSLPENPKDIYFLVFDRYPGLRTLSQELQFDNREFYEKLRKRGFIMPPNSRSNYAKTSLSMGSALNMQYMVEEVHSPQWYYPMFRNPIAIRLLREAGYKYYHIGNWASFLRTSDHAAETYKFWTFESRFASVFWSLTPMSPLIPELPPCEITMGQREFLHRIARKSGPKVVYAHFLLPHTPYCFHADGSMLTEDEQSTLSEREKFLEQLQFANQIILEFVDELRANSTAPPIIVVQADEGPYGFMEEREDNRLERIRRRTDIINALYLPDDPHPEIDIPDDITPVNTFRLIFQKYFNMPIPLLPDKVYFWEQEAVIDGVVQFNPVPGNGNRLIDVTTSVRAGEAKIQGPE